MFALKKYRKSFCKLRLVVAAALLVNSFGALAQPVGEVEFSRGVGFAQSPGKLPRALGRGLQLNEGDRLTTAGGAAAIVKLQDGTRMTLRPDSEIVVQQYQFSPGSADNSMVLQLLRGGLRALTGLISKSSADAAKIQTSTATIGIRGTDFDARICGPECKQESSKITEQARPNAVLASAKLVSAQGDISAIDGAGTRRKLADGGSVYVGETVDMGAAAKGILVFRDESRLTLGANTRFSVVNFVFDDKNPAEGKFLVSLLRGSMRALTGLIGTANSRNVGFATATATIGIRGTGLDLDCNAEATEASCNFFTWLGTIEVTPLGQTAPQTLPAGQGLFVSRTEIRPLTAPTLENLPRPDTVPVNMQQLFSSAALPSDEEGLYVYVRDGDVRVASSGGTVDIGRGETAFAGSDGQVGRPLNTPLFIQFDTVPLPNATNPEIVGVVGALNSRTLPVCP